MPDYMHAHHNAAHAASYGIDTRPKLSLSSNHYHQAVAWLAYWGQGNDKADTFQLVCNVFDRTADQLRADLAIELEQIERAQRFPTSCADY